MQVRPVSAIHPLRIRSKQMTEPVTRQETSPGGGRFDGTGMIPAHIAASALACDTQHGAHAEYAAQLLADPYAEEATELERRRLMAHYTAAEEEERTFTSYTISI
ncbi:hypothetical protein [Roseibium sp.]|uniref:hypothetical protein n=1 Tax=Roseibium sp. TaxID=1936156 RepID=UPI003D0EC4B9